MARRPRIEYNGAFYHVITRGNQRQQIFKEIPDFQNYLNLLSAYKQRYRFQLYAYVLMDNHVHLLIETKEIALSKILQGINQSYTMYFNKKYRTVGHLFQGRYKSILCDRDHYLLALIKYICHNPVRAQIAETPGKYRWSSYRVFSEKKSRSQRHYEAFMNDGVTLKEEDVYATIDQRLLGDEKFIEEVARKRDGDVRRERRKKAYLLSQIAAAMEKRYHITLDQMQSWSRAAGLLMGRRVFSLVAKGYGYRGREIAEYLRKDPAAVTGYLQQGEGLMGEVEKVVEDLTKEKN
jgi:REP element-mobilizing transposase RayT